MPPLLGSSLCLFLPRSLCCSWYSRLTLSINSHFSQQPVKLTKFLARISFSCRTLRSSMSSRQLRSDREALRMVTAASSGLQFTKANKGKRIRPQLRSFGPQSLQSTCWGFLKSSLSEYVGLVIYPDGGVRCSVASGCKSKRMNANMWCKNTLRSKTGSYIPHEHNPRITLGSPYPLSRMNLPGLSPENQALNWWHVWEGWGSQVEQSHPLRSGMEWRGRGHH